jgi:ABC-type maltose transport system permease subunit
MTDQSALQGQTAVVGTAVRLTGEGPLDGAPNGAADDVPFVPAGPPSEQRRTRRFRRVRWVMLGFIAPALVVYLLMVIVPSVQSLQLSFTNWDGISPDYDYVGVANYEEILGSGRFWNAVKNTLILGLGSAIIINAISPPPCTFPHSSARSSSRRSGSTC